MKKLVKKDNVDNLDEDLIGTGLIDWVKNPIGEVKKVFSVKKEFNNTSKKTMGDFGNFPVIKLKLMRTPILKVLDAVINLLSFGKFNEAKEKYGFDNLYHLALVCTVKLPNNNTKDIICEKNEVVNISTSFGTNDKTETLDIPIGSRNFTVNSMLLDTLKKQGEDKFFLYDGLKNNCQFFISYNLQTLGLYNYATRNFLFQNIEGVRKMIDESNPYTSKIMNGVTSLGALFNKWLGKGISGGNKFKLTKKEQKLLDELESHFNNMRGGIVYRKGEEDKQKALEQQNNKAKADAKKRLRKESGIAKAINKRDRENKVKGEEENIKNEKDRIEKEKSEDQDLLKQIDPQNPDREIVDRIHSAPIRSYLQHQHSLKDFRKFVARLNEPRADDIFYSVANAVTGLAKEAIKSIPKIGEYAALPLDAIGDVDNPNDAQRAHYNNQLNDLDEKIEAENPFAPPTEGSGKGKLTLFSVIVKDKSLAEGNKIAKDILKKKRKAKVENNGNLHYRSLPKTQFMPRSWKSKIVNPNVTLTFGVLKE